MILLTVVARARAQEVIDLPVPATPVEVATPEPNAGETKPSEAITGEITVGEIYAGEIPADQRKGFEAFVDANVTAIKANCWEGTIDQVTLAFVMNDLPNRELYFPPEKREPTVAAVSALGCANVDWESFLVRGPKNHDFPKMLFYNEYFRRPLYFANPANLGRKLLHKPRPAINSGRVDGQIPHSSFFTNTHIPSYTPERLVLEFESFQPKPPMEITKVKEGGTSEGIWIKDANGRKHIMIFDPPFAPEMLTSAEYIGSTLMRMAGYHVPEICISAVEGTGNDLYDGRRAVATIALDNFKGGWKYDTFKDRREIRALQVFAAWINNVDQTEQNTGVTIDDNGVCRHYFIDFGACLGSFTFRPQMARLGWTKLFSAYNQFTQPLYDRGIRKVPWEAPYQVHSASVGYFNANFDPDRWQPFYSNMGFVEITEEDRRWAACRIAQFTDEQIRAVVGLAGYTHASDAEHVANTLIQRRDIIVKRYLGQK